MDAQHEKLPSHGSTLQQLLQALNAELFAQKGGVGLGLERGTARLRPHILFLAP